MEPPFRIDSVVAAIRARRVSATEVAASVLRAVERVDGDVRAFTAVEPELVLDAARALDARVRRGEDPGPLAGVPIAVKDLIDVTGLPSSYGTLAVPERLATSDATCVARLRAAGAIVVGKTRTSELAWRADTPPTLNPTWPELVPGGSSGGSAAAVAAGLASLALGTDTGGSIRWPAVQCGIAGLKPTTGLVPLDGVLPCSPSLDCVGPLAPTVADLASVVEALTGARSTAASLAGARLGLLEEPFVAFADEVAAERFAGEVAALAEAGATVVTTRLPHASDATAILDAISYGEGSFLVELASGRLDRLSPEVRAQLLASLVVPAAVVERARRARVLLAQAAAGLFASERLDALVLPTCTVEPVRRDGTASLVLARATRAFQLASATGQPSLVIPSSGDRPGGLQLLGRPFGDAELVAWGAAVERVVSPDRI